MAAGTYTVTVSDSLNCSLTGIYVVPESYNPPKILVEMSPVDCSNATGIIQIELIQGGTPPLKYSIDGGAHFYSTDIFDQLSSGYYQVMVTDANGCTTESVVYIPQPLLPIITPLPDVSLKLGDEQTLAVQLQPGFPLTTIDTVIWSPNEGLEFTGATIQKQLHPKVHGIGTQQYTVTLITDQGCETSATFRLNVDTERNIFAPNVIWPEGSNVDNSAFTLFTRPGSLREILVLNIYDRWGTLLFTREHFEPDNPRLGWQGDFRGEPMNPAVFVWWAEVEWTDGKRTILKGDVTVVR